MTPHLRAILPLLLVLGAAWGQTPVPSPVAYRVSTYAGVPWNLMAPAVAPDVYLKRASGVSVDPTGNVYVGGAGVVRRMDLNGNVTTLAGADRYAENQLEGPEDTASDGRYLYVSEFNFSFDTWIRRIDLQTGEQSVLARTRGALGNLQIYREGDVVFRNGAVGEISRLNLATGSVATLATVAAGGPSPDGTSARDARLSSSAFAMHPSGDLYLTDAGALRRIRNGVLETVLAGNSAATGLVEGPAAQSSFKGAEPVEFDGDGRNLYLSTYTPGYKLWRLRLSDMVISHIGGSGQCGEAADGLAATRAPLCANRGLAIDLRGRLLVPSGDQLWAIGGDGILRLVMGLSNVSTGTAPRQQAIFDHPLGLSIDSRGVLVVADTSNCTVKTIDERAVTVVAQECAGGAVLDDRQNLFMVNPYGGLSVLAAGPGAVRTSFAIAGGWQMRLSRDGKNLFYLDWAGDRLYRVDAAEALARRPITPTVLMGSRGSGFADGAAAEAKLRWATGLAEGANGDLYLADKGGVRRLRGGVVSTLLPGTNWESVAFDSSDKIWASAYARWVVLRTNGVSVENQLGRAEPGLSRDGLADLAVRFRGSVDMVAGKNGDIFLSDRMNNVIRRAVPVALQAADKVDGDGQSGVPGNRLARPLRVRVRAADGAPIEGVPVRFSAPHLSQPVTAVTDAQSIASFELTLPPTQGPVPVAATVTGLPPVSFQVTSIEPAPVIRSLALAPEYGGGTAFAGGSRLEILGHHLAAEAATSPEGSLRLAGVEVLMNQQPLTLLSVQLERIVGIAPDTLPPGPVPVEVRRQGVVGMTEPYLAEASLLAPRLMAPSEFHADGRQFVYARIDQTALAGPESLGIMNMRPAKAGEKLTFTATGFGGGGGAELEVRLGDVPALVEAIVSRGLGVWDIVVVVPAGVNTGAVSVGISVGGVAGTQQLWTQLAE